MPMFADPSNFELGLPVVKLQTLYGVTYDAKIYRKYLIKVNETYSPNFVIIFSNSASIKYNTQGRRHEMASPRLCSLSDTTFFTNDK